MPTATYHLEPTTHPLRLTTCHLLRTIYHTSAVICHQPPITSLTIYHVQPTICHLLPAIFHTPLATYDLQSITCHRNLPPITCRTLLTACQVPSKEHVASDSYRLPHTDWSLALGTCYLPPTTHHLRLSTQDPYHSPSNCTTFYQHTSFDHFSPTSSNLPPVTAAYISLTSD